MTYLRTFASTIVKIENKHRGGTQAVSRTHIIQRPCTSCTMEVAPAGDPDRCSLSTPGPSQVLNNRSERSALHARKYERWPTYPPHDDRWKHHMCMQACIHHTHLFRLRDTGCHRVKPLATATSCEVTHALSAFAERKMAIILRVASASPNSVVQ